MAAKAPHLEAIEPYLSRLATALPGISQDERDDFLREIRAHILDRLQEGAEVDAILEGLGSAEQLAGEFNAETALARSARSWSALVLLRTAVRLALTGTQGFTVFLVALLGYGIAATLYISAALKPIFPNNVGIFVGDGNFNIGFSDSPLAHDISGPYFTLYAMILGFLTVAATTVALRAMMRKFAAARRRFAPPPDSNGSSLPPFANNVRETVRTWSSWKLLRTAVRWALTGAHGFAAFIVALVGYLMAFAFYVTAVLKPVYPDHIGIFVGGDAGLTIARWPAPTGQDIAGPYYTLIAIIAGFLFFALTTFALRQMMQKAAAAKRLLA